MQHSHLLPNSIGSPLPERFLSRLVGFADLFTRPTWSNVLVLLGGVILAPGRRTVSAAALPRQSLVRPNQSPRRDRHRHRHVVSRRCAAGADPLASRPRSQRRARAASFPRHRPHRSPLRHPRMVRQPLAGRSNICGGSRSPRRRNPAPVVRQSDPSHHTGPAWIVLTRHTLGTRPRQITKIQAENRRMVSKNGPHLQRRDRGGASRNLALSDFFHVPAEPRQYRNSPPYLEPNGKCTRSRRINRPKPSLEMNLLSRCT